MKEATLNALRTLNKYKAVIGIGIGVAIAIGAGVTFFITEKSRKTEMVWQSMWKINSDLAMAAQRQGMDVKDRNAALNTAADAYRYIKDNMSSSSATPWVLFQVGNIYYGLKNYDEAIRTYNEFLSKYSGHSFAPIVKQSLGYAYEEKGLLMEAVKQFNDVSMTNNNLLAAQEGWDAGRCYEKLGQTNEAIRSYTQAVELSPNSNWAVMSQYRLSVIK
ncbi:MAG: hypothetical protein A3G70_02900 [Planctomycetes bacterium RIFCSPLOWO2_12_FULL_39_13]|nr:MAG: hypothetical protein A2Y11_04975 [Planctomycetes bacterium GWC2_39_26]OHB99805.1 MAG: hypothetical protein A3G70_02900 [Planctomycetes bacterium RIFCSPLOWO2_12_FULL_39_13]